MKDVRGTALDYSEDLYRHNIEVVAVDEVESVISKYSATGIRKVKEFVYEFDSPIQVIPEIIRELGTLNIAVYQIIRIGRCSNTKNRSDE